MGMRRQAIMGMGRDVMIVLARLIHGVDMHGDPTEQVHLVEELMTDFLCNGVPFDH